MANRLVALSSAAVLTVYAAGYWRTRAAAERLQAAERPRIVIPSAGPLVPAMVAAVAPPAVAPPVPAVPPAPVTNPAKPTPAPIKKAAPAKPAKTADAIAVPSPAPAETIAPAAIAAPPPAADPSPTPTPSPVPQSLYKDGTFSGWGTSRHGDIEATVVIESGRIVSAYISQCWTRYSCSWVAHLPGQVVARQSAEVDYVSGATQSANAFYYAVVQALSKAK